MRAAPGQQAGPQPGPGHARNEEPKETVGPGYRHTLPKGVVGLEMAVEETGPLHPAAVAGDANAHRKGQDDPARSVWTGLPGARFAGNEPPGGPPGHPGKDAAVHSPEAGASAHGPGHRPQGGKKQRGQEEVMRQVPLVFAAHFAAVIPSPNSGR